jgi:phage terminase small subunit
MANPTSPEQSKKKRSLTGKQKLFVDAYIGEARFNATKAARIAGYADPPQSGWENKQNLDIRARIDELLEANTLSATEILRELTDVAMRGLHEYIEITRYDKDGNPVAAKMDARAKMEALKLLGQNKIMFTEKRELSGPDGGPIPIQSIEVVLDDEASS